MQSRSSSIVSIRCRVLRCSASVLAIGLAGAIASSTGQAADATWTGASGTSFNQALNWSPASQPDGTATFGNTAQTSVTIDAGTSVDNLVFTGTQSYTITNKNVFIINGPLTNGLPGGIIGSGPAPTIINSAGTSTTFAASLTFAGFATASSSNITNGGGMTFADSATAGRATIVNAATGNLQFSDNASLGDATITNAGQLIIGSSAAGNATITTRNGGETAWTGLVGAGFRNVRLIGEIGSTFNLTVAQDTTGDFGSIEGAGAINLKDTFDFHVGYNNLSTTFSGVISGANTSNLIKEGSGTLTLSGANTYAGTTEVRSGTLVVDGSIGASATTVDAGAILGGSGTVGALAASGTVAPGSPTKTLNVNGNVTFASGSKYLVDVNAAGQSSKIAATGAANLSGGTVNVRTAAGTYNPSTTYTILTAAGGLGGTQFKAATLLCGTSQCAFLTPTLSKDATDKEVRLTLVKDTTTPTPPVTPTPPTPPTPPPPPPKPHLALTQNQAAALQRIDSLKSGPLYKAVLFLGVKEAPAALDLISGEVHADVARQALDDSDLVSRAILERLRQSSMPSLPSFVAANASTSYAADKAVRVAPAVAQPEWNVNLWGQGFGAFGNVSGTGNAASFDRSTGGFVLGADTTFGGRSRAGIAGAFTSTSLDIDGRLSSASIESWHIAAYGGTSFGALNLRGGAILSHNDADTNRTIAFRGFSGSNGANYSGTGMNVFGEVGYGMNFGAVALEPFAGLRYARFDGDAFTEEGTAASALRSTGTSFDQTSSQLGLRVSTDLAVGTGALSASASAAWRYAFDKSTPGATLALAAGGSPFTVTGVPVDRNSLVVETGLSWAVNPKMSLGVKYDGAFGESAQDHAFKGQFDVRF